MTATTAPTEAGPRPVLAPPTPTQAALSSTLTTVCQDKFRPSKRQCTRPSIFNDIASLSTPPSSSTSDGEMDDQEPQLYAPAIPADTTESLKNDVGPFLSKYIPSQYAPQGTQQQQDTQQDASEKGNTRYCYRHRPDIKCRRQADEPTMEQLQKGMETLPPADQEAITHVWSLFSAAPATHRNLMLQGILTQCCFPQLSFISAALRDLIRIDFLTALPPEIAFKILCYLDTTSLCKAAQVSRRWRILADDDVVWHKMCEQHIDRKCDKCGWGLPLLERKRLRASKRQMELRSKDPSLTLAANEITAGTSLLNIHGKRTSENISAEEDVSMEPKTSPKRPCQRPNHADYIPPKTRPWKDVYSERYKVESNWRRGRCTKKVFKGHKDGVLCLQFNDTILATGSYDRTIKIWDIETGEEIRTLVGHDSGVRALMFDDTKLISASQDKTLRIWNYRTGECISVLRGHTQGVISLHFDSTILVSGSIDKTVKVWNFKDKNCFALKGHTDWVNSVRIDSDSRMIFSASDDATVRMWDLDSRACVRVFKGHVGHVQAVIPLSVPYKPETPKETPSLLDYRDASSSAAKSRAAPPRHIATAALDSTVKLWDTSTGKCINTLFGHVEGVWALAADSLRVVSGAQDKSVKVWDVRSGKCQRTITGHAGPVTCVGLSDSRMVSGSEDGEVRAYCFKSEGEGGKWVTPPERVGSPRDDGVEIEE
ncbi:hypothetical protein RUND412_000558 [Rhizina undulata]